MQSGLVRWSYEKTDTGNSRSVQKKVRKRPVVKRKPKKKPHNHGEHKSNIYFDNYLQNILQYLNDTEIEKKICFDLKSGLVTKNIVEKHKDFYFEQFRKMIIIAKEIVDCFNLLNDDLNLFNLEDNDFKTKEEESDRTPYTNLLKKVQDILEPYLFRLIEKCSEVIDD